MQHWQEFVEPYWLENCQRLADWLLPLLEVPADFLRSPQLIGFQPSPFPGTAALALETVQRHPRLRELLELKDLPGGFLTLGEIGLEQYPQLPFNLLIHLWEFAAYERLLGRSPWGEIRSSLHWGGGYGDAALLLCKLGCQHSTVIDLPIVLWLQEEFLSRCGIPARRVCKPEDWQPSGINLVPLPQLPEIWPDGPPTADLFYSVHALSECTAAAQDYVLQRNFFNCPRVMLLHDPHHPDFSACRRFQTALQARPDLQVWRDPHYLTTWGR